MRESSIRPAAVCLACSDVYIDEINMLIPFPAIILFAPTFLHVVHVIYLACDGKSVYRVYADPRICFLFIYFIFWYPHQFCCFCRVFARFCCFAVFTPLNKFSSSFNIFNFCAMESWKA